MKILTSLVAIVAATVVIGSGCGNEAAKGTTGTGPAGTSTAAVTASKTAAPAATTTAAATAKAGDKKGGKKKPAAKPADAKQTATKGGDAGKDKPPSATSKKADDGQQAELQKDKKKVEGAPANACDAAPDFAAECGGDNIFFCAEKELYQVDCNEMAKEEGFDSGSCFETEKEVDCLGCIKLDDGSIACCNAKDNLCCDEKGFCWKDENGGDDAAAAE